MIILLLVSLFNTANFVKPSVNVAVEAEPGIFSISNSVNAWMYLTFIRPIILVQAVDIWTYRNPGI